VYAVPTAGGCQGIEPAWWVAVRDLLGTNFGGQGFRELTATVGLSKRQVRQIEHLTVRRLRHGPTEEAGLQ
jgi:DNA-directed RNA polymerase sigma subunit (sigma70/sigma32)